MSTYNGGIKMKFVKELFYSLAVVSLFCSVSYAQTDAGSDVETNPTVVRVRNSDSRFRDVSPQYPMPTDGTGSYCSYGYYPKEVVWAANGSETDAAATLTGICPPSGVCRRLIARNWDTTNSVMIQFNSSSGTDGLCLTPATATSQPNSLDSSLWISPATTITNLYRTTTGTTSCATGATVAASHMSLIGCP